MSKRGLIICRRRVGRAKHRSVTAFGLNSFIFGKPCKSIIYGGKICQNGV